MIIIYELVQEDCWNSTNTCTCSITIYIICIYYTMQLCFVSIALFLARNTTYKQVGMWIALETFIYFTCLFIVLKESLYIPSTETVLPL